MRLLDNGDCVLILRPYQQNAITDIRNQFKAGNRSVLYTLPTGGGKSLIFSWILKSMYDNLKPAMVLVHRRELLLQTAAQLKSLGVSFGVIQAGVKYKPCLITIASVQTLVKRTGININPKLIVQDECHHFSKGNQWAKIRARYPGARLLGVTATPERLDGKGMADFFNVLICGPNIRQLTDMGFLSPIKYYSADFSKGKKFKTIAGDYDKKQMESFFTQKKIFGSTVKHFQKFFGDGKTALIFCVTIKHCEQISYHLRLAGFDCPVISGKMDYEDRSKMIKDLAQKKIHGLCSCEIISEGTDIPTVDGCVLLRRTQSLGLFLQQIGRCLRISPDKSHAIILDHAGNVFIHGRPDDNRTWTLKKTKQKKKKKDKPDNFIQCKKCYLVFSNNLNACPECKQERIIKNMEPKETDGELKEIKRREMNRERAGANTLEALIELGNKRGYKPGWANHVWRARQSRKAG